MPSSHDRVLGDAAAALLGLLAVGVGLDTLDPLPALLAAVVVLVLGSLAVRTGRPPRGREPDRDPSR